MSIIELSKSLPRINRQHLEEEVYLSVIVPFYNEEAVLSQCHESLLAVLDDIGETCEIIYVDDGSNDASWHLVSHFKSLRHQIQTLSLSRNFGKEAAMTAGLKVSQGKAVVILDADLQDPPELMKEMLACWKQGFDVVDMQRSIRHGESWFKRKSAAAFYKMMSYLSDVPIPENVGDFRLLDRKVVDVINDLPEKTRFMKGLFACPGFKRTCLQFDRDPRLAGETKWNFLALLDLAFEGVSSFSIKPLRLATVAGVITSLCALSMLLVILVKTLMFGEAVAGYPSMITVILFLGSVQLLSIGLLGEYIGRLFIEAKQRPVYLLMEHNKQLKSQRAEGEVSCQ